MAHYVTLCQETRLVPIIEPEVLMTGAHTFEQCQEITTAFLLSVFDQLDRQGAMLDGLILKCNIVFQD
jgi:fructose-bisphosphate aldolase class I